MRIYNYYRSKRIYLILLIRFDMLFALMLTNFSTWQGISLINIMILINDYSMYYEYLNK